MKKKLLAALLTLSMFAATLGGCGSTPQEGSTTADTKAAAESTETVDKESGSTDGNLYLLIGARRAKITLFRLQ